VPPINLLVKEYPSFSRKRSKKREFCFTEDCFIPKIPRSGPWGFGGVPPINLFVEEYSSFSRKRRKKRELGFVEEWGKRTLRGFGGALNHLKRFVKSYHLKPSSSSCWDKPFPIMTILEYCSSALWTTPGVSMIS
jgi:hypothetical protein